jgi:hypothetical protein
MGMMNSSGSRVASPLGRGRDVRPQLKEWKVIYYRKRKSVRPFHPNIHQAFFYSDVDKPMCGLSAEGRWGQTFPDPHDQENNSHVYSYMGDAEQKVIPESHGAPNFGDSNKI